MSRDETLNFKKDETLNFKKFLTFLRWNIPMGRRQNMSPDGGRWGFPPKKLFGYVPKYALSIWGPASKKIF
jgi:hypothetical protein